jgi:hypothetical protein
VCVLTVASTPTQPPPHHRHQTQVEGNYLLLDEQPWLQLRELLDDAWFCDTPLDEAMGRVFERQTAIGVPPEVSRVRIATNDRPNGGRGEKSREGGGGCQVQLTESAGGSSPTPAVYTS